jgi:hypothetical protein
VRPSLLFFGIPNPFCFDPVSRNALSLAVMNSCYRYLLAFVVFALLGFALIEPAQAARGTYIIPVIVTTDTKPVVSAP